MTPVRDLEGHSGHLRSRERLSENDCLLSLLAVTSKVEDSVSC